MILECATGLFIVANSTRVVLVGSSDLLFGQEINTGVEGVMVAKSSGRGQYADGDWKLTISKDHRTVWLNTGDDPTRGVRLKCKEYK